MTSPITAASLAAEAASHPRRFGTLPRLLRESLAVLWAAARGATIGVVLAELLSGTVIAAQLFALRRLFESGVALDRDRVTRELITTAAVLCALAAAGLLARSVSSEMQRIIGERTSKFYRDEICAVSASVPLVAYEDSSFFDALQRAGLGVQMNGLRVLTTSVSIIRDGVTFVAVAAALTTMAPIIAGAVMLTVVPLGLLAARSAKSFYEFSFGMTVDDRERNYLSVLLSGRDEAQEVRAYLLKDELSGRMEALWQRRLGEVRRLVRGRLVLAAGSSLIVLLSLLGILFGLTAIGSAGGASLSVLATAAVASQQLVTRARSLAGNSSSLYECALFLRDFDTFRRSSPPGDRAGAAVARNVAAASPSIIAAGLSFTYPGATRPALRAIDLTIHPGEVLALVGENGSGKTTLAKLLCGLLSPSEGSLRWDGIDLADDPVGAGRAAIVFQNFTRYQFTLAENVAFGDTTRDSSPASLASALGAAGLGSLIEELPHGMDTRLGRTFPGAVDLSGGQWQRVALARALFRDARVLVLDEPSASLDPRAEFELFETLRGLYAGRTVVLISHRLGSVRNADRIAVLQRGELVELGPHADLVDRPGGLYAELFEMQASAFA